MGYLVLKKEMSKKEFDEYKKERIDGQGFKMGRNPAGDLFFTKEKSSETICAYVWTGGYLIQELD